MNLGLEVERSSIGVVLSLPIFRLVRSRSLSLGAWVPKNLARRRKPSAARCLLDLLDLLGPPGRRSGCWPHDSEVAGGAVADSTLVISGSGRWPRRSQVRGQLRHDPIATAFAVVSSSIAIWFELSSSVRSTTCWRLHMGQSTKAKLFEAEMKKRLIPRDR